MKTCKSCLKDKPESEFYRDKTGYLFARCKSCANKARLKVNRSSDSLARYNERQRIRKHYIDHAIGDETDWDEANA